MKGYVVESGYMGYVDGQYVLLQMKVIMQKCMKK